MKWSGSRKSERDLLTEMKKCGQSPEQKLRWKKYGIFVAQCNLFFFSIRSFFPQIKKLLIANYQQQVLITQKLLKTLFTSTSVVSKYLNWISTLKVTRRLASDTQFKWFNDTFHRNLWFLRHFFKRRKNVRLKHLLYWIVAMSYKFETKLFFLRRNCGFVFFDASF